jgi:hypothetical protein
MELTNPLKLIPSQYYLPLAVVAGGLIAWRFIFSGGDESPNTGASSMGYDPSLVALGVQTSLERDKLNASTELGKLAMQTELQAMDKQYTFLGTENALNAGVVKHQIDSAERVRGAELGVQHAELDAMQYLGNLSEYSRRHEANIDLHKTVAIGNAQTATAKASKKKGFSIGGFSLSF